MRFRGDPETEPGGRRRRIPSKPARAHLLRKELHRALIVERSHRLVVAPFQVFLQLSIQLVYASERFTIIKVSLVVPVAPLDLTVLPRRTRRDQLVFYPQPPKLCVERTFYCIADESECEFDAVVRLYRLYPERKCFYKHPQKLYRILGRVFLKSVNIAHPRTFVYRRPLV